MPFNPSALAQAAQSGYDEPPPPGHDYESQLYEIEMFEAKAGTEHLRLRWRVLAGPQRDHEWSHVQSLDETKPDGSDNSGALSITAQVLDKLGVDVASIQTRSDMRRELDKVEGRSYLVEVKRNGQYVNTMPRWALDHVQESMPDPSGYGHPPQTNSAIYQGDAPEPSQSSQASSGDDARVRPSEQRREPERTGVSDVPGPGPDDFKHPQPAEDDEPIPF